MRISLICKFKKMYPFRESIFYIRPKLEKGQTPCSLGRIGPTLKTAS